MPARCPQCSRPLAASSTQCGGCGAPIVRKRAKADTHAPDLPEPAAVRAQRRGSRRTSLCDHGQMADEAVTAYREHGLNLDFSVASLAALDVLLAEQFGARGIDPSAAEWRPSEHHRRTIILLGSYLGEVIRVRYGGEWKDDHLHPGKPLFTVLSLGRHGRVLPLERAYRRLKDGSASALLSIVEEIDATVPRQQDHSEGISWAAHAADFMRQNHFDVAQRFLDTALRVEPNSAEAWMCSGMLAERLGKPADAKYAYEQAALRVHAGDEDMRELVQQRTLALADANAPERDHPAARSGLPGAEIVPTQEWETGDFPTLNSSDSQVSVAKPLPQSDGAPTTPPSVDAGALVEDAWNLALQGRFEEAVFCFRHANNAAEHRDTRLGMAALQLALGKPAEALLSVEPLVTANDTDACLLNARALAAMKQYQAALATLNALPPRTKIRSDVRLAIAENLLALGRSVDALEAYTTVIRATPLEHRAWLGIAAAATQQGDATTAVAAFAAYHNVAHPAEEEAAKRAEQALTAREARARSASAQSS